MSMRRIVACLMAVACLAMVGCAKPVQKDWIPTSGSRADATIKLSFEYNPQAEIPQTNEQQAMELAKKRCNSWGYPDVEAFGGHMEICAQFVAGFGGVQCIRSIVTKEYQCIGRGDSEFTGEVKR